MNREKIHRHIDVHLDDHIDFIRSWIAQPSVSWDNNGVVECAELVAQSFRDLGCSEVEIVEGAAQPGVWAYYDAGSPVTLHNYGMFDTRTVRPDRWSVDPWAGAITPVGPYSRVLIGAGAMVQKGPYAAFLNALRSIVEVEGTLPVNIMFLAEGEEIMGSPGYRGLTERFGDRLASVQASYCPTANQAADGRVQVGLGLKGMIVLELTASGEAWGYGPRQTIHSSGAGLVDSPPFRLAHALASLTGPGGRGCGVTGLEDIWAYRKPLTDEETDLLDRLRERYAGRDWRDVLPVGGAGNVNPLEGDAGLGPLIRFLYGPTFNVAGLRSGFLGAETSTIPFVVPSTATATLDLRLVVDVPPPEIIDMIRGHLDARGFSDIRVDVLAAFAHAQGSVTEPIIGANLRTLQAWGAESEIWPIQGGGGPWTVVPNAFGVPCLRGGVVGGGKVSDVDEYLVIDGAGSMAGLAEMEKFHVDLLEAVANSLGAPTI